MVSEHSRCRESPIDRVQFSDVSGPGFSEQGPCKQPDSADLTHIGSASTNQLGWVAAALRELRQTAGSR
jgi:hypothetical protein